MIARALTRSPSSVQTLLGRTGRIRPPVRRRAEAHLSLLEREEVSRGIAAGLSARAIAARMERSPSTISREIRRNGGRSSYRAAMAEVFAIERGRRPKPTRLGSDAVLLTVVRAKLEVDWSPEQIAAWLRRQHRADPAIRVSHETTYRTIHVTSRAELGVRPGQHLRSGRAVRRPRRVQASHGRGRLRNMTSIHACPVEVLQRAEVGHWEGDLVMGKRPSAIATLVE